MSTTGLGERLVSVHAIVMTWDERYNGWQPSEGGGVSNVVLYQRLRTSTRRVSVGTRSDQMEPDSCRVASESVSPSIPVYEYVIYGEKSEDKRITIHCHLTKDTNYRSVMPTFHHWQIDQFKYGLKFMSAYEACRFHNRIVKAIEHLHLQSKSSSGESNGETEDLEEDVFMNAERPSSSLRVDSASEKIDLPTSIELGPQFTTVVPAIVHQRPSTPSSAAVKKKSAASVVAVPSAETLRQPSAPVRTPTWPETTASSVISPKISSVSAEQSMNYPQVYFQKETSSVTFISRSQRFNQQPSRSLSIARSSGIERRESSASLKVPLVRHHLPSPVFQPFERERRGYLNLTTSRSSASSIGMLRRERCMYCKNVYWERDNVRGSCASAPDVCSKWIRRGTCIWCAECLVFRCCGAWTGMEELVDTDVCSCTPDTPKRTSRWIILSVLACLLPCLCLYPPLKLCHAACRRRGWLGSKHTPNASIQSSAPRALTPEPSSSGHYR